MMMTGWTHSTTSNLNQPSKIDRILFQICGVLALLTHSKKDTKIRPDEQKYATVFVIFLQRLSIDMVKIGNCPHSPWGAATRKNGVVGATRENISVLLN